MKARGTRKSGASAKRWREALRGILHVSQVPTPRAVPYCCKCGRPIPADELAASAWGGEYICETCYYAVECVAMRGTGLWGATSERANPSRMK